MKKLIVILVILVCGSHLQAQDTIPSLYKKKDITQLTPEDYQNIQLPPLEVLLQNINKNPSVKFYNSRIEEQELELKETRRSWLEYIRLSGNIQYGVTNDLTSFEEASNIPVITRYAGKLQTLYGVGATFGIPISEIIGKRNKNRIQKTKIDVANAEMEIWRDNQTLIIIDAYADVSEQLNIIKELANAVVIAKAQFTATENDFINGRVDTQGLSFQKNILTRTVIEYERCRSVLTRAILKLELVTKTNIIK